MGGGGAAGLLIVSAPRRAGRQSRTLNRPCKLFSLADHFFDISGGQPRPGQLSAVRDAFVGSAAPAERALPTLRPDKRSSK